MKAATTLGILATAALAAHAGGATLALYDFNPTTGSLFSTGVATEVAAGLTASNVADLPSPNNRLTNPSFNGNPNNRYPTGAFTAGPLSGATTPALALSLGSFVEITLDPDDGLQIDIDEIVVDGARGGSSTPRGIGFASSLDNFASVVVSQDFLEARNDYVPGTPYTLDLGTAFQDISVPVTFRVLVYSPGTSNTVDTDFIRFEGSVEAIPEPASVGFIGLTGMLLGCRRRRG